MIKRIAEKIWNFLVEVAERRATLYEGKYYNGMY
jgi:hypothetical protein